VRRWREFGVAAQFVLEELSLQCRGKAPDDLVFGDGKHYLPRPKSSNGWFTRAAKAAEVQAITPHDLRLFDTDVDAVAAALDLKCAHSVPKPRPIGVAGA
jgi:hypothetical protein